MAVAGTLAVNIIAKTDKFRKGVGGARKDLKGFRDTIGKAGKALSSFGGLLAGAVGVGSMLSFARSTLASVDALAKVSDKLGTSTEALGFWRFAAGLAGVQATQLDTAFQRMVRRLGQAAQGTGEAVKVLDRFNLDAKELIKLDPGEQFRIIGENINSITNQNEKLAAAMALFDTEGVGLVNLFASDIGKAADEFERLGLAVSRSDAAKIEEFNDSVSKLKQTLGAKGRDFVIGITPIALEAVKGLEVLFDDLRKREQKAEKKTGTQSRGKAFLEFGPLGALFPKQAKGLSAAKADILRGILQGGSPPLASSMRRTEELERRRKDLLSGHGPEGARSAVMDRRFNELTQREALGDILSGLPLMQSIKREAELEVRRRFMLSLRGRREGRLNRVIDRPEFPLPLGERDPENQRRFRSSQNLEKIIRERPDLASFGKLPPDKVAQKQRDEQNRETKMQTKLQQATLDAIKRGQQQPAVKLEPATF